MMFQNIFCLAVSLLLNGNHYITLRGELLALLTAFGFRRERPTLLHA